MRIALQQFLQKILKKKAVMYCYPEQVYRRDMGWVNSLYISYLDSMDHPRRGLGTVLLNFATKYSEQLGYNGRFHVEASNLKMRKRSLMYFTKIRHEHRSSEYRQTT